MLRIFKLFCCIAPKPKPQLRESIGVPRRKKNIPKKVKIKVWDAHIGPDRRTGPCYACKKTIDVTDFHCAHVTAEANGGAITVANLRPTCAQCNLSCGDMNLDQFAKMFT